MHRPQLVTAHDAPEERPGVEMAFAALAIVVGAGLVSIMSFSHAATVSIVAALVAAVVAAAGTVREAVLVERRDWAPTEALVLDLAVIVGAVAVVLVAAF
jgi:hypothetical protein